MNESEYPEQGSTEARELFVSHYRAKFGPHPAERNPGEFRLWAAVIDRIEPRLYERVVAMMSLGRDVRERGKPRLDELRAAHSALTARVSFGVARPIDCAFCGGCGWFSVPARQTQRGGWTFESNVGDERPLYMTAFACKCSAGDHNRGRIAPADLAAAWEVLAVAMRAAGVPDADKPMTRKEFLAQHRGDKVLGVSTLFAEVVRESYRNVYGTEAAPETVAELADSRTLAYLRSRSVAAASAPTPGGITLGDIEGGMVTPPPAAPEVDEYERLEREAIQSVENEPW